MCGIAGILLAPHAADPRRLIAVEAMAATLHHRGPDGGGIWIDSDAGRQGASLLAFVGHPAYGTVQLQALERQGLVSAQHEHPSGVWRAR